VPPEAKGKFKVFVELKAGPFPTDNSQPSEIEI
jgi:hypothetical protein